MLIEYENIPRLRTVISGGQTGADQAGLFAAKACGFETGGFAPQGFRTLAGNKPDILRDMFGLEETVQRNYQARTGLNAKTGDATIRLATNFGSPGELCTLKFIQKYDKPYFDVNLNLHDDKAYIRETTAAFYEFLVQYQVQVLNVAGNADRFPSTGFGFHFHKSCSFLIDVFTKIKNETQ